MLRGGRVAFLAFLSSLAAASASTLRVEGAPVIVEREVHLTSASGEPVVLAPGNYYLSVSESPPLLVTAEFETKAQPLAAQLGKHAEKLAEPVAESIAAGPDEHHLVLLLPDGRSLDAAGSYSGLARRGGEPASADLIGRYRRQEEQEISTRAVLEPAPEVVKPRSVEVSEGLYKDRVIVKVRDGVELRAVASRSDSAPTSLAYEAEAARPDDEARMARAQLTPEQVKRDLATLNTILGSSRVLTWGQLIDRSERFLEAEQRVAERATGEEHADLANYYFVILKPGIAPAAFADELNAIASVELAYIPGIPEPADVPPPTPDKESSQGYLNAAPGGVDAKHAWTKSGGRGAGVKVVGVEFDLKRDHEDLPALVFFNGAGDSGQANIDHGTSAMGAITAVNDGHGVTGIAADAQLGFASIVRKRNWFTAIFAGSTYTSTAEAIDAAASRLRAGDVITMSIQTSGPSPGGTCACNCKQYGMVPVEWEAATFNAIRRATARGIYVMEAAGNGGMDLDNARYKSEFDRTKYDSRAIMVGASKGNGDLAPACFTGFGSRVDVHAWGDHIWSTGYGDGLKVNGADQKQWYTDSFGGTSGATPIVAGVVATLVGISKAEGIPLLTAKEMRALLTANGTPQKSGTEATHIGPQPDLAKLVPELMKKKPAAPATP